jgi:CRISPR-associated protein Cmr4
MTMFEAKAAMFLYSVSPVHMGAGTAIGAIDNPIQRERHTQHPMMAGSGVKGALRHEAARLWDRDLVNSIFGPDPEDNNASDHAGALSFGDAQIVLFPVRSLRQSYVYATCPTALARLARLLEAAGLKGPDDNGSPAPVPTVERDQCIAIDEQLIASDQLLVLEAYQFVRVQNRSRQLAPFAKWLSERALPAGQAFQYFRKKIADHTVLLHDDRFNYFARNATVVEPHVRINDESGTADDRGLFYTENVPPEALFVSLAMASKERRQKNGADHPREALSATKVIDTLNGGLNGKPGFGGRLVQVGGDSTTGRGQVVLSFVGLAAADAERQEVRRG